MFEGLRDVVGRYEELQSQLADPAVAGDHERYSKTHKELSDLEDVVTAYRGYLSTLAQIDENKEMLGDSDDEIRDMAKAELSELEPKVTEYEDRLKRLMLPTDPLDSKDIILEIRAGAGGDESALFSGNLLEMYQRFATTKGWKVEVLSASEGAVGGFRELVAQITGNRVYSALKWESGVHRVQRVPDTESQGRIHTSTATVAVLAEAEEVDVNIDPGDLRIDTYRASGAGGQHVNRTESAIRITHLPSGLVVQCQDQKSQHKNKARAMKVLASRLVDQERQKLHDARADDRRSQVGTGDRSERIRTYNYPQNRVTDHRIGLTLYKLDRFLMGEIDEMLDAITAHDQAEQLKSQDGY